MAKPLEKKAGRFRKRSHREPERQTQQPKASAVSVAGSLLLASAREHWMALGVFAGLILVVLGRVVTFGFVDWDDNINVYENPYLLSLSWDGLRRFWVAPYASLYVPLVYTTYFVELLLSDALLGLFRTLYAGGEQTSATFFRIAASLMHLDNLLLHLLATQCVYLLLRRLGTSFWAAVAGASVFAIHPLQVEPVAWITGRKDLLCWCLSFVALERWTACLVTDRFSLGNITVATASFAAALLAKPSAVVVPVLALSILLFQRCRCRWAVGVIIGWGAVALCAFLILRGPQTELNDAPFQLASWKRPFLAAHNLLFYFEKLVFPIGLVPIYPRKIADVFSGTSWWVPAVFVIVALAVCARSHRALFGVVWIILPVAPTLGIVPFIYQYFSVVADRYFYASMVGVAWFLALGVDTIRPLATRLPAGPRRLFSSFAWIALALLGAVSFVQTGHWKSSESLWQHQLSIDPRCVHALYNLASRRVDWGQLREAIEMYERILVVDPYYAAAYTNLILLYDKLGNREAVRTYAQAALELPPNCAENFIARGHAYLALDQPKAAIESFLAAIHGLPEDAPAHNSLGMAYLAAGEPDKAELAFRQAIALNPALIPAHENLAELLRNRGEREAAKREYQAILQLDPLNAKAKQSLEHLERSH